MRKLRDLMGFGDARLLRAAREVLEMPIAARPEWAAEFARAAREGDTNVLAAMRFGWGSCIHRAEVVRGVGLIEVRGPLVESSWCTDYTDIRTAVNEFAAAAGVHSILLDIDSPGGVVHAELFALCERMREVRAEKPLWTLAGQQATSAAYVLAAQGSQLYAANENTSILGSLGVIWSHVDYSGMYAKEGIVVTHVTTGRHKGELLNDQPLSDEARATMERVIEGAFVELIDSVHEGRPALTDKKIRMQEAAIYLAGAARGLEMVDQIAIRADVIEKLAAKAQARGVYVPSAEDQNRATAQEASVTTKLTPTPGPTPSPAPTPDPAAAAAAAAAAATAAAAAAPPAAGAEVISIDRARGEGRAAAILEMQARANAITDACRLVGMPQLAGPLIADANLTEEAWRKRITDARAAASPDEIFSAADPGRGQEGIPKIDTAAIYRRWNGVETPKEK